MFEVGEYGGVVVVIEYFGWWCDFGVVYDNV